MKKKLKCKCLVIQKSSLYGDNKMFYCRNIRCYRKGLRHEFPKRAKEMPLPDML